MNILVNVDVQNDFVNGKELGTEWAQKVVPNIIKYNKMCRNKGYAIYATVDTHSPTVYDTNKKPIDGYGYTLEGQKIPIHCIEGTEGHKIVEGLVKDENRDIIIPQGYIVDKDIFGSERLPLLIQDNTRILREEIDCIELCGFCTSICVINNALLLRDHFPNTPICIIENLCADINKESHKSALIVAQNNLIDVIHVELD